MMGFYIMICTVHTTQGQGTIAFYCAHPSQCPGPSPMQCVRAIIGILPIFWASLTLRSQCKRTLNLF